MNKILRLIIDKIMHRMQNDSSFSYSEWKEAQKDYKEIFGVEYVRKN